MKINFSFTFIISLFIFYFEFFSSSSSDFIYLSLIIISSIIPLFYFNFKKENKVVLGDSGSLFIGTLISIYVLKILSQDYVIKDEYDLNKIMFVLSIFFYPIVDIVRIVFIRIYNGKSPFNADKNHLHHIILKYTKSHWKSTTLIILVSILNLSLIQLIF